MIVSVIISDRMVVVDGEALTVDLPPGFPGLRAIQWNGSSGAIEFNLGPQQYIDNALFVQPYIDAFNVEKARIAALQPAGQGA